MKKKLIKALADSKLMQTFLAAPSPKWLVFATDIMVVILSCLLTYSFSPIGSGFSAFPDSFFFSPWFRISTLILVYVLIALLVRPYKYIIRLSFI